MSCSVCKENREAFGCDGCSSLFCKACGELTSSEVEVLQLAPRRVLKFHCSKCKLGYTYEPYKEATVSDVRQLRNGGVACKCSDHHQKIEDICDSVQRQIGTDYEVIVPKKNPEIKIYNVKQSIVENEV
nr:unnamed protein product [Callosobruchus analis]